MELKPRTRKEFLIADFIDKDTPDIVPKTRSEMFLKQMLDKSSKPSWNDLTDKPFGEESSVVEVLAEFQVTMPDGSNQTTLTNVVSLKAGETYTVNWNGVDYACVAQDYEMNGVMTVALGDINRTGSEPFVIMTVPPESVEQTGGIGMIVVASDMSPAPTISIRQEAETIKTIDPKYIVLTSPNGTKYNLSVSDDGTLSAVAT